MGKFAKVFDLDNGDQVLVSVHYDDQEDKHKLVMRTDIDGIELEIKLGYEKEDHALKILEGFSQKEAEDFRLDIEKKFFSKNNTGA